MDMLSILNKEGYTISPYYEVSKAHLIKEVKKVNFTNEDLHNLVVATCEQRLDMLYDENKLVLFKYDDKYIVKSSDIIEKIEKELISEDGPDYDELVMWSHLFELTDNKGRNIFVPFINEKYIENDTNGVDDYLFEKDEHIVAYLIFMIQKELNKEKIFEDLQSYVEFAKCVSSQKDISRDKRFYTPETTYHLLNSLAFQMYKGENLSYDAITFYRNQLIKNAEAGNVKSMKMLGYEYYEGGNGFEYDQTKACYWLEKYYEATEDPDVARTLGYIYYYGRTTNGVPQGDKAFQYFAIGHFAGQYFEATYKLADCYVNGYGTPKNYQSAYNLVNGIYNETYNYFIRGEDSKFADVALRLGSYYKDGIYVKKDLYEARRYFLEAKIAIKKRLEHNEYVGDRGVALGISKSLDEIEQEVGISSRVIDKDGYIITKSASYYKTSKISLSRDGEYIHLVVEITKKDDVNVLFTEASEIGFMEISNKAEYFIKPIDAEMLEEVENELQYMKINQVFVGDGKFFIELNKKEKHYSPLSIDFEEAIVVPQTIKDIYKKYMIVSVTFPYSTKQYDYICDNNDVKVGDTVKVLTNDQTKSVEIKSIKYIYEDELPLPYEKMSKIL